MIGVLRQWIDGIQGISTHNLTSGKFTIEANVITSVIN